jgi:hypothetical protein
MECHASQTTVRGGVDEIYFGKQTKFITVVSNLETGEPLWFGQDRKQETLDEFFRTQLNARQRERMEAACVDMWRPFTNSIEQWAQNCRKLVRKLGSVAELRFCYEAGLPTDHEREEKRGKPLLAVDRSFHIRDVPFVQHFLSLAFVNSHAGQAHTAKMPGCSR